MMNQEDKLNRDIAKRIRTLREEAGLSQEELGSKLALSKVGYGHYERGTHAFSAWQIVRLSRILNRSVPYLLGMDTGLTPDEDQLLQLYRRGREKGTGDIILRTVRALAGEE